MAFKLFKRWRRVPVIARDRCDASPLTGTHDVYTVDVVHVGNGVAYRLACALCGKARLDDFTLETKIVEHTAELLGTVRPATRTTIRNNTGRHVTVYIDGQRFDMVPDWKDAPDETIAM